MMKSQRSIRYGAASVPRKPVSLSLPEESFRRRALEERGRASCRELPVVDDKNDVDGTVGEALAVAVGILEAHSLDFEILPLNQLRGWRSLSNVRRTASRCVPAQ